MTHEMTSRRNFEKVLSSIIEEELSIDQKKYNRRIVDERIDSTTATPRDSQMTQYTENWTGKQKRLIDVEV